VGVAAPPLTPLWGAQVDKSVDQNLADLTEKAMVALEEGPVWMKYHAKHSLDTWLINNFSNCTDEQKDLITSLLNSLETQITQVEAGQEVRREFLSGKTPFEWCLNVGDY
jgi:hypothetical protein